MLFTKILIIKLLYIFVGFLTNGVYDVSAQTSCVISPDLDMLAIRNPLGRDVDLHCQCMDDNGIITGTRWFLPNRSIVSTDSSNRPYSTGTAPGRLIFTSPFTDSDAGTYTCSPDDTFPTMPPGDNITLNAAADPGGNVNCTIVSTNLPTVTAAGGVITNGTQNVILYCICMRVNSIVTVGRTRWFFNGIQVTLTQDDGSSNPYSRNNVPSTLIIPSFVAPHDGDYSCAHNDFNEVARLGDTITLTLPVPTPIVSVTAPNNQTVGQSLTLQCEVTTVRGITSRVDIVWRSGGTVLQRMNNVSSTMMSNSLVYTNSYTISQLSTTDDGRVIQCEVVINVNPEIVANDQYTLDVNVPIPVLTISPSGPIKLALVNSIQAINCTVNTVSGVESNSVMISWMGPGGLITTTNGRISIGSVIDDGNNMYTRSLQFTYLMEGDEGTYTCNVMILDTSGSQSVELQSLTVEPPTSVMVTVLTPQAVQVTWTLSSSSNVTGYLISYTTNASYTRGGSVMVSGNSAASGTLNNLEEGTTYTITVQATESNNRRSGNSNAVIVTTYTTAPSSPPQNVMITSINPASLMVAWQPPPPIDQNGLITGYVIQYTRVGSSDPMTMNVSSETVQTLSGLVAYVDYSITVAAMNVNGTGPYSNTEVGRSGEDRPSEPESLDMISVNSSSVMLQWRPPLAPNGVIVLYSLKYNSTTLVVTNASGDVLMHTIGGLTPENVYLFQVTAHTGAGEGSPTSTIVVIPPSLISDVTIPNESVTASIVTLSWMEVNLMNSVLLRYTVFYLPVSGPYDRIMASNRRKRQSAQAGELTMDFTTGTAGTLMDLNGSVTYSIEVAAVVMLNGQVVTGDRSTTTEITTLDGVPSAPRNLNYANLTTSGITLTWSRPDPPNGLITQYNISYSVINSQCEMLYNFTILPVNNGGGRVLSYTWIELIQGRYQFSVVASTSTGPGESASLMLSILPMPSNEASSDSGSDDNNGVIIALATLLAITVIGLVISVVINVFVILKPKLSRYDVDQSNVNVRYSDVKPRDQTITEYANQYIKSPEPEYETINAKSNMKPHYDVKMDANPAYQATSIASKF